MSMNRRFDDPPSLIEYAVPTFAALFAFAALLFVADMDRQQEEREFQRYCRMVDLHDQSGGTVGWPDYRDLRDECKEQSDES